MPTPGNNPIVEVIGQSQDSGVTTTSVRVREGETPAPPAAPAGLWPVEGNSDQSLRDLHKLIGSDEIEGTLTFESYGEVRPLLELGSLFVLRPWWTPDAYEAVTDTRLTWQQTTQKESDDEHCLLTWETINRGSVAYRSDAGWVSDVAYQRFIADDMLRLRG